MKKNDNNVTLHIDDTRKSGQKKALRNLILKLVSKYKDTDKMISDDVLSDIFIDAAILKEVNYIKFLIKKCKKNMSSEYLNALSTYVAETSSKNLRDENDLSDDVDREIFLDELNKFYSPDRIKCIREHCLTHSSSNEEAKVVEEGGIAVEEPHGEIIYTDIDIEPKLYTFKYIVKEGDTYVGLCKKFNLPIADESKVNAQLTEGEELTFETKDQVLAQYQQAIYEYVVQNLTRKNNKK